MWTHVHVCYMILIYRRSACRLSVTFVRSTRLVIFLRRLVRWLSVDIHGKFYRRSSQGNHSVEGFKRKRGRQNSDFDIWNAVSPKQCKIGGTLVLITNRKSYMSFRLVPKSVTLNDLERRNGPYFALFYRIWLFPFWVHCVKVVDKTIAMDNLRLLCLVVNVSRGTARRPLHILYNCKVVIL